MQVCFLQLILRHNMFHWEDEVDVLEDAAAEEHAMCLFLEQMGDQGQIMLAALIIPYIKAKYACDPAPQLHFNIGQRHSPHHPGRENQSSRRQRNAGPCERWSRLHTSTFPRHFPWSSTFHFAPTWNATVTCLRHRNK